MRTLTLSLVAILAPPTLMERDPRNHPRRYASPPPPKQYDVPLEPRKKPLCTDAYNDCRYWAHMGDECSRNWD